MTLAPVIGGSERQGFRKHSLCSEKKEQIIQSLQNVFVVRKSLAFSKGPEIAYAVFLISSREWQTSLI